MEVESGDLIKHDNFEDVRVSEVLTVRENSVIVNNPFVSHSLNASVDKDDIIEVLEAEVVYSE